MVTRVGDGLGLVFEGSEGLAANVAVPGLAAGGVLRRAVEWRQADERGRETVATGFPSLDRLLPAGGVRRGSLVEWLAGGDAGGAISLACAVACRLADPRWADQSRVSQPPTIVVVDRGTRFYPPAVTPWLESPADATDSRVGRPQLLVARPARDDDELWTIDQALRCPGVAAVLAWPRRVHATAMRRWQLASRASGAVGLLVRGLSERVPVGEPTWADAKLAISPVAEGGLAADLAVRRLRLSLAGGPWAGDAGLDERSAEVFLDLTNGREATRRHRMPARHGAASAAGRFQSEGVACRAS